MIDHRYPGVRDEDHRPARWHELGVHPALLPPYQRSGARAPGRPAFGTAALYSLDFHEIEALQRQGDWAAAGTLLADAARRLESAGADLLLLCTNTMHKVADAIEAASALPLLHIADPTAAAIQAAGLQRVGLLGTRFTMEQPFYRQRLEDRHGIQVLSPDRLRTAPRCIG